MAELQPPAPDYPEPVGRLIPSVRLIEVELPASADDSQITDKDETAQ